MINSKLLINRSIILNLHPLYIRCRANAIRRLVFPATVVVVASSLLAACTGFLSTAGPSRKAIGEPQTQVNAAAFEIVDVNDAVTRQQLALRAQELFSETLATTAASRRVVGPGDVLEVWIWEAPPAVLFTEAPSSALSASATAGTSPAAASMTSRAATLPEQVVDDQGAISVPFVGRIGAGGKTLAQISSDIAARLHGKAHLPQVIVRLSRTNYATATVVGEVNSSVRAQLLPGNDRLLDALAAAGGVRSPVNKTMIQVTRGSSVHTMALETVIRDPNQNVALQPGDVVTALFQPFSFTVLGASGKNEEIPLEARGISLAQALGRAGGLASERSNARGVFIFRLETVTAIGSTNSTVVPTPDGRVPVIYRIDLSDPRSFFVMQSFPVADKDVLYVSDAPVVGLQKFLNVLVQAIYPFAARKQLGL